MGPKVSSILAMVSILVLLFGEPSLWLGSHPYPGRKKQVALETVANRLIPCQDPGFHTKGFQPPYINPKPYTLDSEPFAVLSGFVEWIFKAYSKG